MKNKTNLLSFNGNVCDNINVCDNMDAVGGGCVGYFTWTPNGGDHYTCPICRKIYTDVYYRFCSDCGILFENGCTHAEHGSCYNAHFVGKWKVRGSDQEFIGMPTFASVEDLRANAEKVVVLEWICPNNGLHCKGGSQYYHTCKLQKDVRHLIRRKWRIAILRVRIALHYSFEMRLKPEGAFYKYRWSDNITTASNMLKKYSHQKKESTDPKSKMVVE